MHYSKIIKIRAQSGEAEEYNMDFKKENERKSYVIGKKAGFLFSYLLFFSMMWFVFTKFKWLSFNYFYWIGIFIGIYILYMLIKKIIKIIKKAKKK